jgi:hypothetical protein
VSRRPAGSWPRAYLPLPWARIPARAARTRPPPTSRSQRAPSRRQQLNPDSDRSTRHRCCPSRVDDSTSRRAIRGRIPRRRGQARLAELTSSSYGHPCGRAASRTDGLLAFS